MNGPLITPELRTPRLLLRPVASSDSPAFFDIYSDAETLRFWSREPVTSLGETEALVRKDIEASTAGECICWGVAQPDSNLLVGKVILFQFNEQNRRAELGYILDRRHWGKGYMSEAMAAVLVHAFETLGLHRLEADTDPDNAPSLALLEKFGFQREGLFRHRWLVHGRWHDSVMLGLLAEDFRNRGRNKQPRQFEYRG